MAKGAKERIAERRRAVFRLRAAGFNYRYIAAHLNVALSTVHADAKTVMEEVQTETRETAAQMIVLESERLDAAQFAIWHKAMKGDVRAIDHFLKIHTARCLLFGLYKVAPRQELPTSEPERGIDPEFCSVEELSLLLEIMDRQKEARADETPAASTRNSGKSRESQRPGES